MSMTEERSVFEKRTGTYLPLIVNPVGDNTYHRLVIAGLSIQPTKGPGGHLYDVHLFGPQAAKLADRVDGTIWWQFVREPTDPDDQFAPSPWPISAKDPWWGATPQATIYTAANVTGIAIEYMTHVPGLRLKNSIYKAWT